MTFGDSLWEQCSVKREDNCGFILGFFANVADSRWLCINTHTGRSTYIFFTRVAL